jgi:hypothetical protein
MNPEMRPHAKKLFEKGEDIGQSKGMNRQPYPNDLSEKEWAILAPRIPVERFVFHTAFHMATIDS